MARQHSASKNKRRTTLTLPSESLMQAQQIANSRKVNLSTVMSEVIAEGLKLEVARNRSEHILASYRQAFRGYSDDELAILNGVMLEPVAEPD